MLQSKRAAVLHCLFFLSFWRRVLIYAQDGLEPQSFCISVSPECLLLALAMPWLVLDLQQACSL